MRTAVSLFAVVAVAALCTVSWAGEPTPSPDRAYVDAVIDAMVASGLITAEKAAEFKAQGMKASAAVADELAAAAAAKPKKKQWYDTIKLGGYVQARGLYYPDAEEKEVDLASVSLKKDSEFLVRRARIKLSAKPASGVEVVIQPDFGEGDVTIKDAYVDKKFGNENTSMIRVGQHKVPFGFEGPQSSSSRLPLERNWVARRTISGERDTGIAYYYTDPEDAKLFGLAKDEHFGTGDFGNIAVAFFNGQGIEDGAELNSDKHIVLRGCKPMLIKGFGSDSEEPTQYLEFGASYYAGDYVSKGLGKEVSEDLIGIHGYLAPQPFGLQAEYFTGETEGADIDGFYVMALYRPEDGNGTFYARYDELDGRRKGRGAKDYTRDRWTVGYAHELEDGKNRVTVEYSEDTPEGGDSWGEFGVQLMTHY